MSIRPSSIYNAQSSADPTPSAFVVIGNTALATIQAIKAILAYPTIPVYVLSTGADLTANITIESLRYIAANTQLMMRNLVTERLHLILPSNAGLSNLALDDSLKIYEQYYQYYTGAGPLGDSIAYRLLVFDRHPGKCGKFYKKLDNKI
jgi:hypothetical protein